MNIPHRLQKRMIGFLIITVSNYAAMGQILIKGFIFDRTQQYPVPGVSVMGTSGAGTATDSTGHYSIRLPAADSIYFSYLGRRTTKFPVTAISDNLQFDMSIDVGADSLPSISIWSRNYLMDSLTNRQEYQKVFDFRGSPYIDNMKGGRRGRIGMGLDMDMFLNAKTEKQIAALQKRLEEEEQQKYVDHRFTKDLVKRITRLEPPALDSFMVEYRPSYEFTKSCTTDWDFYKYILDASKAFLEDRKEEQPKK
jgi:hypothetical protein